MWVSVAFGLIEWVFMIHSTVLTVVTAYSVFAHNNPSCDIIVRSRVEVERERETWIFYIGIIKTNLNEVTMHVSMYVKKIKIYEKSTYCILNYLKKGMQMKSAAINVHKKTKILPKLICLQNANTKTLGKAIFSST